MFPLFRIAFLSVTLAGTASIAAAETVTVHINDTGWPDPATITVHVGDTVEFSFDPTMNRSFDITGNGIYVWVTDGGDNSVQMEAVGTIDYDVAAPGEEVPHGTIIVLP